MKSTDEHSPLNELLTGPEVAEIRETSLRNGLAALQRARRRRQAVRGLVLACVPAVLVLVWLRVGSSDRHLEAPVADVPVAIAPATLEPQRASSVEFITDEELLAFFPDQALALVGSEGHQQLIFFDN